MVVTAEVLKRLRDIMEGKLLDAALPDVASIAPGVHFCPTSPTECCAYDHDADPASDECLFCGDPHERG